MLVYQSWDSVYICLPLHKGETPELSCSSLKNTAVAVDVESESMGDYHKGDHRHFGYNCCCRRSNYRGHCSVGDLGTMSFCPEPTNFLLPGIRIAVALYCSTR